MKGGKGAEFPGCRITMGLPKSPKYVTSTSFSTVNLHPKELRFEHRGAKLASCPRRHLTSLHPWFVTLQIQKNICLWLGFMTLIKMKPSATSGKHCQ